jgi:transcriptional regulator with XRE-family HTH domain
MIRNERQYRVTLAQRGRLTAQLELPSPDDVPAWVSEASRAAVESQILELDNELAEYTALREGTSPFAGEVGELNELPRALIRARIAAKLTQRELAERLHLKEQQIQKYEATDYAGASVTRLQEVMTALGVTFRGELLLPLSAGAGAELRRNLQERGMSSSMLSRRFFAGSGQAASTAALSAAARAARIFQPDDVQAVSKRRHPSRAAAFRAPANANLQRISGYSQYAEYLAGLLVRACVQPYRPLPAVTQLRETLGDQLRVAPLQSLLSVCWAHGIPVLPLADAGSFHGACWWIDGRPAIALKHGVRSPDRWAFLLGHEMEHARAEPEVNILEEDLPVRAWREQPAERAADSSASSLLLGEQGEAMAQVAVETAHNEVDKLKAVVPAVAAAGNVSLGVFADYVATRVNSSSINWWPTANSLHPKDVDAWRVTRNALFGNLDLLRLDELDREILMDGISP